MSQDAQLRLTAYGRHQDRGIHNSSLVNDSGSMHPNPVSDQGRINTETSTVTGNISPGTGLRQQHQTYPGGSDWTDLDSNTTIGNVAPADRKRSSRGEYEQVNKSHDKFQGKLLQQQPLPTRKRHRVLQFWIWEVLSVCLAIGLLGAIVLVLSHFHGEIVPEWRFSINLNTLIALLATIARAAMLSALAEILGQVKWSWFSRPRPLNNIQHFDNASRGLIGSLVLPFIASKNLFAIAGSLVVVFSLAIGPFAQQAIKSVDCLQNVSEMNASVPMAHYFGQRDLITASTTLRVDMKGAMINALVNPTGNDSKITATCQTGNCTFQSHSNVSYSSIGLCSACIDTTPLVQIIDNANWLQFKGYNYSLPNYTLPDGSGAGIQASTVAGSFLQATSGSNMSWAASAFTDLYRRVAPNSILSTSFLTFTRAPCTNVSGVVACPHNVTAIILDSGNNLLQWELDYVATSCTFYPCLKNYQATVQQGLLKEQVVSTVPAVLSRARRTSLTDLPNWNFTVLRDPCLIADVEYSAENFANVPRTAGRTFTNISVDGVNYTAPEDCLYKLDYSYTSIMASFIRDTLFRDKCSALDTTMEAVCEAWWLAPVYNSLNATFETISEAMNQFAEAITNKIRTTGSTNYDITQKDEALGLVTRTTICTAFDWQWLLLPISLVATTAALLILTVLQNNREHRQPVWKSSVLPLIFYGIDVRSLSSDMGEPRPVADLHQLDEQASRMRVRFHNGMDAGFVGVDDDCGSHEDIDLDSLLTAEPARPLHE